MRHHKNSVIGLLHDDIVTNSHSSGELFKFHKNTRKLLISAIPTIAEELAQSVSETKFVFARRSNKFIRARNHVHALPGEFVQDSKPLVEKVHNAAATGPVLPHPRALLAAALD